MWKVVFYAMVLGCLAGLAACLDEREPDIMAPLVEIGEASGVTRNAARLSALVRLQGAGAVSGCRFVCDTARTLTGGRIVAADALSGEVEAFVDSLRAGTDYYYCLEVTNGYSTVRSENGHFRTLPNVRPVLGKMKLVNQGPTTAVVECRVRDEGGEDLSVLGFRYKMAGDSDERFVEAELSSDSTFRVRLTGLRLATEYQTWACAANAEGETLSDTVGFVTGESIYITEPGSLEEIIGEEEKYRMDSMAVAGYLDGSDIRFLREMMGKDVEGGETPGRLSRLDLADVTIVAGGEAYFASHYTAQDVVGRAMFQDCANLEGIKLPNTAKVIEEDAFAGCSALKIMVLPDELVEYNPSSGCLALQEFRVSVLNGRFEAREGVLFNAAGDTLLAYPCGRIVESYAIPDGVRVVAERAFLSALVGEVEIPASVEKLGKGVFSKSSLNEVTVPAGVRNLPASAFQDCMRLERVTIGSGVWSIGASCFAGCPLKEVTVLADVAPSCVETAFDKGVFDGALLYVPKGCKANYRNSSVWKNFPRVVELE